MPYESKIPEFSAYNQKLENFIKDNNRSAKTSVSLGGIFAFISAGLFIVSVLQAWCKPVIYVLGICFDSSPVNAIIGAITLLIVAVILFFKYRASASIADFYCREIIVLRDLEIALNICDNIDGGSKEHIEIHNKDAVGGDKHTERTRTLRDKIKEQIIDTLLARCGG